MTTMDAIAAFIDAACVPLDSGHASGTLELANTILAEHPDLASFSLLAAAALGDAEAVTSARGCGSGERDRPWRPSRLGSTHPSVLLALSSPRSRPVGRVRARRQGAARRRREPEHRLV